MSSIDGGPDVDNDGLDDRFDPYVDGEFQLGSALIAIVSASVAGLITTFFAGIGAIEAGLTRMLVDPLYAITSFIQDFITALFGAVDGYNQADAIEQIASFDVLAFVAGIAVAAAMLYAGYLAVGVVVGGVGDG